MSFKLPQVPPGKILVNKKWNGTALGRELMNQHGGIEFSLAEDLVDFVPVQNVPVLLVSSDNPSSDTSARLKKFKKAWNNKGVVVAERNALTLKMHKEVQSVATLKSDMNVIPVAKLQEVPSLLKDLAYTHTHPQNNQFNSTKVPPVDLASRQLHLLTLIPNVGRKKAQLLVENFGTLKRLSYALEDELSLVIGGSSAKSVHNFFHRPLPM